MSSRGTKVLRIAASRLAEVAVLVVFVGIIVLVCIDVCHHVLSHVGHVM